MIKELYAKIPKSQCKNGCYKCCTDIIQFSQSELKAMGGYEHHGFCIHLKGGRCTVYENRPFVCRIFGASEILKCDDCVPEKFLSENETVELVQQYIQLKKKEELEKNVAN